MCQSVPNVLSYVSAKYYLNWFTVGKVVTKIKGVNFLLRHSVCTVRINLHHNTIATDTTTVRFILIRQ